MNDLLSEFDSCNNTLKCALSALEYVFVRNFVEKSLKKFFDETMRIHDRKLWNLGIANELEPCNPESVIFNFSSKQLSSRIKFLLSFGLDFGLPVYNINFFDYFLSFEKLAFTLKNQPIVSPFNFNDVKKQLQSIAFKYFYGFKAFKVFSPIFTKDDVNTIKSLAADKSIVVTRPDKGRGVVLLNRSDYVNKIEGILSDTSKFKIVSASIHKTIVQLEDKINRFLTKLKKFGMINESLYNELFVSGCLPGVLYGLPKIHKIGVPIRPIFSACGTPAYKLAKFLVPLLSKLTMNEYTVSSSHEFVKSLSGIESNENMYMVSYDVESLFTNIPLQETINICLNALFQECSHVIGITRDLFKSLLELSVLNSYFIFNNKFYVQQEGVGMGLPLGPTFANIFMCFHESKWLEDCPVEFRPLFYKRYVDDCFVLFHARTHAEHFLNYINAKHPKMKFSMETEENCQLPFLDINVRKVDGKFETSIYRKKTFTGLGISFFSFIPMKFKKCSILTLIHRAYRLCSNFKYLHEEFCFLKSFFKDNGFPTGMVDHSISKFLSNVYEPPLEIATASKLKQYITLPYFGVQSEKLRNQLCSLIAKFYPHMNINVILINRFTIGSFFKVKDRIPFASQSSVVYEFRCASCDASYIGSTIRSLHCRVEQHRGRSYRTGNWLTKPDSSSIRSHVESCGNDFTIDNFKIIGRESNAHSLRILESLHIFKNKPNLNENSSAVPLSIIG